MPKPLKCEHCYFASFVFILFEYFESINWNKFHTERKGLVVVDALGKDHMQV